ncbi:hypothetical protein EDB89DRAFT_2229415 [Lactarius sanguifluus]|nr:hypothetical protein EDB89DRAFT_2229415 [Lactarius sanguifluus]
MSGSVPPLATQFPQGQSSALGSGIVGLFIEGIEAGLVFAQFSQWFYGSGRRESSLLSAVIVFVTMVGLAQSGLCFASAWSKYVQQFGVFPLLDWEDYVQPIPSRHWVTVSVITFVTSIKAKGLVPSPRGDTSWLFLMSVLLPSVLDLTLTTLLLYYLTRTMKQVYAAHIRKRISRLVNIVWQSALPPTLEAICLTGFYIQYATVPQVPSELLFWYPVLHGMIGKLYVLSLLYMVNVQPLQLDEQPTTFVSTFTVPAEADMQPGETEATLHFLPQERIEDPHAGLMLGVSSIPTPTNKLGGM